MIPLHDDNPSHGTPFLTYGAIAACAVVFLWQLSLGPAGNQDAIYALGVIPAVLFGSVELVEQLDVVPAPVTILSSMFMHGGWGHLLGNLLYLWIFADNVEDSMGKLRFAVFYVLCGVAAALAQAVPNPTSTIPMIGASGAISGVLGAYVLLFPHARILTLVPLGIVFTTVRISAMWVLGLWFLLQLVSSAMADPNQPGVAFGAHIGGFVAGLVLVPLFKRRRVRLFNPRR